MPNGYVNFSTEAFSAAFPSVRKPRTEGMYAKGEYEVTAFLNEVDDAGTLEILRKALQEAANAGFDKVPTNIDMPLRRQDDGTFKIRFKSKKQPVLQQASGDSLPDQVDIGRGDLIRVAGAAKAYSMGGNAGVSVYMNFVRLIEKRAPESDAFGGPDDGFTASNIEEPDFI